MVATTQLFMLTTVSLTLTNSGIGMKKVSMKAGTKLGSSFRVLCIEFGRKCQDFQGGNPLWMLVDADDTRQIELDGMGVYDLLDSDYRTVTAIVYEILIYDGEYAHKFSKETTFRHDFSDDSNPVYLSDDDETLRLMRDTPMFAMHDAATVLSDVEGLDGELPQFIN